MPPTGLQRQGRSKLTNNPRPCLDASITQAWLSTCSEAPCSPEKDGEPRGLCIFFKLSSRGFAPGAGRDAGEDTGTAAGGENVNEGCVVAGLSVTEFEAASMKERQDETPALLRTLCRQHGKLWGLTDWFKNTSLQGSGNNLGSFLTEKTPLEHITDVHFLLVLSAKTLVNHCSEAFFSRSRSSAVTEQPSSGGGGCQREEGPVRPMQLSVRNLHLI